MGTETSGAGRFDAERFIDRLTERELFRAMIDGQGSKRLLTLCDQSEYGKSHLLKRLEWMCAWEIDPPIAVGFVPINEVRTVHAVVAQAAKGLENGGCVLNRFTQAEQERIKRRQANIHIEGSVNAESNEGEATGVKDVTINAGEPDFEAQEALRAHAVRQFLADLEEVSKQQPVVLLIDAFEKSGEDLATWIALFIRDHVLNDDRRLIVVIAGQQVPTTAFRAYLQDRFDEMVTEREALSKLARDHVEDLLKANGVQYDVDDVDYLHRKLQQGWSIGRAMRVIEQYQREDSGNRP
jgi:hypothetical protein